MLIMKASGLVTVMYAFFVSRIMLSRRSQLAITYAPMSERDSELHANLNKMYNCDDVECVDMLRMRRTPFFFHLCNLFREKNLLRDSIHSNIALQKSKLRCFSIWSAITNDLEWAIKPL